MEEELGTTAEEEAEDEKKFSEIAEHEIVGRNLLGVFGPLLARIVANEVSTATAAVASCPHVASALALCRCSATTDALAARFAVD
jgi:hypothetical protein